MAGKKIETLVESFALPVLESLGYELVDIEYKKEGSNWYLRLYIDKDGGITLDDCQRASELISDILDEKDPIPQSYFFEVSSPGLDRPLKKDTDFEKFKGYKVDIKLYRPYKGQKIFSGELQGMHNNIVTITSNENIIEFKRDDIAIIRLSIDY